MGGEGKGRFEMRRMDGIRERRKKGEEIGEENIEKEKEKKKKGERGLEDGEGKGGRKESRGERRLKREGVG